MDNAGASLVPSPVTATTLPKAFNPKTNAYLWRGWERAITFKFSVIFLKLSIFLIASFFTFFCSVLVSFAICLASASVFGHLQKFESTLHSSHINPPTILIKLLPVIAWGCLAINSFIYSSFLFVSFIFSGVSSIWFWSKFFKSISSPKIPHSFAIAVAVIILSPVTIITLTEASLHFWTASLTPSLKESLIPKTAKKTKSYWSINWLLESTFSQSLYSFSVISLYAIYNDLNLFLLNSSIDAFILPITPLSNGLILPESGSK